LGKRGNEIVILRALCYDEENPGRESAERREGEHVGLNLEMTQKQELSLTPQLLQSMEILQMNTCDLRSFLMRELQENPVLEAEQTSPPYEDAALLTRKIEWLESQPERRQGPATEGEDPVMEFASRLSSPLWEDTLEAHLSLQLPSLGLSASEEGCARFLIRCVDKRGYLDEDPEETAKRLGVPAETVMRIQSQLRKLDPPGICARNLPECLAAQLDAFPDRGTALAIAERHLEDLSRGRYASIAKSLGVSTERVLRACDAIRALDPCPGAAFSPGEPPAFIIPDVLLTPSGDDFDVRLNDKILPDLSINTYYSSLLKNSDSDEVRSYLAERFQRARWLMFSLEQRRGTLLSCAHAIVDLQKNFFRSNGTSPAPMSLADVAQRVGIHPSTVSRAIRDKYLQFGGNVCLMKSLFSRGLGGGSDDRSSAGHVQTDIRRLIEEEDKTHPLSDQQICDLLIKKGFSVSRRTIAKYRGELGIPGTAVRRVR
jgi:RNA polymerase sigma-54 factor